ncbi:hypothetical protein EU642_21875 [Salmonella enterica]|nr:hypothetical protein [Salmonella enterica]EAO0118503.1 hypothetical protein [Salmonella enterica]EAO3601608.1 hypothetical protein [Salmonella enterica]EAR6391501.1 hypothetical protein [Salmonella enterica]EAV1285265.1 hypothetical protein [Salmonella enterica]
MQTANLGSDSEIPFPSLFNDKKLIAKVIPIFNVMHDTALTEKEASSLLDLIWRYACDQAGAKAETVVRRFTADTKMTVIQEIRKYYPQRPFILNYGGVEIEITPELSETDAYLKGFNATFEADKKKAKEVKKKPAAKKAKAEVEPQPEPEVIAPVVEEPVAHRKKTLTLKKTRPVAPPEAKPAPAPEPVTAPTVAPVEDDDDQSQFIGLQTYGVNPGEPLSRAVARVWPHRPALLSFNGKVIPITAEMGLVDAQIEAADVAGIDGNQEVVSANVNTQISQSGRSYHKPATPYDIAQFDYPIPVDDSKWKISHDRNSGADFIRTARSVWLDGYPFRISCVPFEECMNTEMMFYVHCRERPDQEMFDVYHRLFQCHTHKVHVRKCNVGGEGSKIITNEYCSWRPKEGITDNQSGSILTSVMEALGLNCRWEPGARFRIRYWDTNVNAVNHRYYATRPNDQALAVLKHPKLKPVIQSRPAGI